MWRWLGKSRADNHAHDPSALPGEENGRDNRFRLESLEPRLLLSGDPVLAELARWAESDGSTSDAEELAVIFQEIDLASEAAVTAGNGSEESARGGLTVAWPEGWKAAEENSRTEIKATAKQIRFAASGHDWFVGEATSGPVDLLAMVTDLVGQALEISTASTSETSGESDGDGDGRQAGVDSAVTAAITSEQLNLVLDSVVNALSSGSTDGELADRLGDITLKLADLDEGLIAEIQGNVILIDITAAGQGWFLDALIMLPGTAGDSQATDEVVTAGKVASSAQQATGELVAQQEQSAGQDKTTGESTITLAESVVAGIDGSSENRQTSAAGEDGRSDRDATTAPETIAENSYTLDQIQTQPNPVAGEQDSSSSSPTAAANSPADLLEQVLDLVGLATGLQGEMEAVEDGSDLVIGLVAASHRLQESNRSSRSELRKDNSKTVSGGETSQDQGSLATESEVTITAEGGEDAAPRGPPAIVEDQILTEDDSSDTAQGLPAVSLLYDEEAPEKVSTDTEMPQALPTDDEQPRAPPAVADMPRAPPVADDSTTESSRDGTAVDADPENGLTAESSQTSSSQDTQTVTHEGLHQDGADYLLSTGTPDTVSTVEISDVEQAIIDEAIARWNASGLVPVGAPDLTNLIFLVDDLAGDALAEATGTTITIDITADGFGWFIDTTPSNDAEFNGTSPTGVDLLTVVMHEIGHVLGYEHGAPGLDGLMAETLAAGERHLPAIAGEMTLNEVIDALLLIRFDPVNDPNPFGVFEFTSADAAVPDIILVGDGGEFSNMFGQISTFYDLQLEKVTLKFSLMSWNSANNEWDGQVSIESAVAVLMPGTLDTVIIDDGFETPIRIESAGTVTDNSDGTFSVDFTLKGDQRDGSDILKAEGYDIGAFLSTPFTSGLSVDDEIAILNANQSGFDDLDLADDSQQILVTTVVYDADTDQTTVTVKYNFNPEADGAWSGGGVIAEADIDIDDDGDTNAVGGTIFLGSSAGIDLLNLNTLEGTDLGLPIWLDVRVTSLQLQFVDFRADDTNSTLRLNAELLGINTGSEVTNNLLRSGALGVGLSIEGSVQGIELDMDALRDIQRLLSGELLIPSFPIVDVSGITASVSGNFFKLGSIQGGLILKSVMVDNTGAITTVDADDNRVVTYGAINGAINMLEKRDEAGNIINEGMNFSFNLAVSELGPLQLFISLQTSVETIDPKTGKKKAEGVPIGTTGLLLDEVRGGIRFNADIEDLQVRPPFGATDGVVTASGDLEKPFLVTLTVPGHNLLVGDEFRITAAGNPNYLSGVENFVVTAVELDENGNTVGFSYLVDKDPGAFATSTDIKKISISDPFDLRDPGFLSTKDLSLSDWEAQLDQQVVNQANGLTVTNGNLLDGDVIDGHSIIAGKVDINDDGIVNDEDDGTLLGFTVINGAIDIVSSGTSSGTVDSDDDGVLPPASFWDVLFDKVVFEAGATVTVKGIDSKLLNFEVDLFIDTTGKILLAGAANILNPESGFERGNFGVNIPARLFADLSQEGETTLLFLMDIPEVPANTLDINPIVVFKGKVTFENLVNGVPAISDVLTGFPSGVGSSVTAATVTDLSGADAGPWEITFTLDTLSPVADDFAIGDSIVVAGSDPAGFDGTYIVSGIDPTANTVSFVIGSVVVNGRVDIDRDGIVDGDADDVGRLGRIPVFEGGLDFDKNGIIDSNDDGEVFNVVVDAAGNRVVVAYRVIDGYIDVDGDDDVNMDMDDAVVIGEDPGVWVEGSMVANEDDLGDGFRITITGGVDLNIPSFPELQTISTLSLTGTAMLDVTLPGPGTPEEVRMDFAFDMSLSESNIGTIGQANGKFSVTMDTQGSDDAAGGIQLPKVELWGAALLTTELDFLQQFGLFVGEDTGGVVVFNNTADDKAPITLAKADGTTVDVTPTAQTFALRVDGSIGLRVDFNGVNGFEESEQLFQLEGIFVFSFVAAGGLNVALFSETGIPAEPLGPATLEIGPADSPYLKFNVFGFLSVQKNSAGIYGVAANMILSLNTDAPGEFAGVAIDDVANFDAQFVLILNTLGEDVDFVIPAGSNEPGQPPGLTLHIPRAPPSSILDANLDIAALINGTAWTLDSTVIGAPYILIHLGGTDPTTNPNASLNLGPFTLTGQFSFLLGAEVDPTTHAVTPLLEIIGNFELDISVGSTTLFNLQGDAFIRFDDNGLVAAINMTQRAGASFPGAELGFTLNTSFRLEINTTGAGFDHDRSSATPDIAPGFRLHMEGTMDLAGVLVLDGTFDLTIDQGGVHLRIDAHFDLFGIRANMDATADLDPDGFELTARLSLATGDGLRIGGLPFNISGGFTLDINTKTGTFFISVHDANDVNKGATVNMMGLVMTGSMTIGISQGTFSIHVPEGTASDPGDPLQLNFFNVASLVVYGDLSFNVLTGKASFIFNASAGMTIGVPGVLGVSATLTLGFDSTKGSFTSNVKGTAWIAGISFSVDASLRISGTAISLKLSITVTITPSFRIWIPFKGTVTVPALRATYTDTFNIGTLTPAEEFEAPVPDPPVLAHVENGILYLHMGIDEPLRDPNDDWDDDDINESFRVTHLGGTAGDESLIVEAFGFRSADGEFTGVSKIVVRDAGDGEDVIDLGENVLADVEVHGGSGNDRISYAGSGRAMLYGDEGDDFLMGGSGGTELNPDILEGGADNDRVQGGSGYSNVAGDGGDDTLIWDVASGAKLQLIDGGGDTGGDFRDTLQVLGSDAGETASVSALAGGGFSVSIDGASATASAIETLIMDMIRGSDTVTINDVSASTLTNVIVRLGQITELTTDPDTGLPMTTVLNPDDNIQDQVILQGSAGTDNITLEDINGDTIAINYNNQVTIAIEQGDATGGNLQTGDLLSIYGNGGNDTIDASDVMTLLLNMQFFLGDEGGNILGSDFDDKIEITVNGNTTGNLQLDGKGGADSYVINLKGGDTDTLITINDTGGDNGDSVVVNGTGGAEIITLSDVQLRQGANSEVLNYSGLETFTINSMGGADDITIFSTSPTTTTVVNSGDGNDRIAVRSVANATTINTGSDNDEIRVGSAATVTTNSNGTVNSIDALLTINGGADDDSLFIDDSADVLANTDGQLTANMLTGLGMASGISYSELEELAIDLGTGSDIFLVVSVHANTATTVKGNQGSDTITVRNASGTVNDINARLTMDGGNSGSDTDTLIIDDSGDGGDNTDGLLSATELTGLGTASGIGYSGFTDIEVHLGSGDDVFTIDSTHVGQTLLDDNGGNDIFNIRSISGATSIDAGTGSDYIHVGSNADGSTSAPASNSGGHLNDIDALLTIDGNVPASGSDTLTIDDTADGTANTGTLTEDSLTGLGMASGISYSAIEHLIISLGDGGNTFTIEDTHGAATSPFEEGATLNSGDGADTVHINGATDQLTVNAQGAADIINVRAMIGTVTVNGNAGNDTINVSSQSPVLPGSATDQVGTVDAIDGLLTVNGGADSDVLNVDDSNPANTGKTGTLTAATLRGLEMPEDINYGTLEALNIWLDGGDNVFNIDGTHGDTTSLYSMEGEDTVNVHATATGSTTNIHTQGDDDTINLSDMAPTLPGNYPASLPPPVADTVGSIDDINGLVVINGGLDDDTINIDDSANSADKSGKLTVTTLRGLALEGGVNYSAAEDLNIWLGTGTDTFYIDSTHNGTTQLYAGDGNATTGERDDTVAIRSISGATTVHGQGGNDGFLVNVEYDGTVPPLVGVDAANDAQFTRTHENNIGAVLNLHGEGDSDHYTVNLAGTGNGLVNVHDLGDATDGDDTLVINGADTVEGIDNQPNDTFLLRLDFVALLNDSDPNDANDFDRVERVNYDAQINAGLIVNSLGGDDAFYTDDNSTVTTLNGGSGADSFQVGQVFGTARTTDANIAPGDTFDTTAVIIGVVRHPGTGELIFNPVEDELDTDATNAILAAIDDADVDQPVDGIAYVSNGISHHTEINGGDGNDSFSVYHNKGTLDLNGEGDNDDFIVRAFVVLAGLGQGSAQVNGGSGGDSIQYTQNAPVTIDGGDGFDTIVVLGTPFKDNFVVTSTGIFGAGLTVIFDNVESVELDTLEGADTIYVLSTKGSLVTTIIGGQGSDTINVLGDVVNTIDTANPDFPPADQDLGSIQGPLIVEGGPLADRDRSLNLAVVLPDESNKVSSQGSPLVEESQSVDTLNVFHTDNTVMQTGALLFRDQSSSIANTGPALTGFGMGLELTIDEGEQDSQQLVTYGGGITYNNFEIIEVLLGSGDETLDISATADAAITAVHGGGGDDTINISDRGAGPLVVYGDTSEDGLRYSNTTGAASVHGTSFSYPGNDTINAAAMADQNDGFAGVVIYGGPGRDILTGSQGDDLLAGGSNRDIINGEAGNDHIYGDSHFNVNLQLFVQDQISRFDTATQLDDINAIFTVPVTGAGDRDTINGGADNDIIFGDHGVIGQIDGTRRLESNGSLVLLQTTNLASGDGDTIHGNAGNDFIFGGVAGDIVYGDLGSDLIFGDHGKVNKLTGDVDANYIGAINGAGVDNANALFTYTSDIFDPADVSAGDDMLYGGSLALLDTDTGNNIILGQQGSDTIYGGGSDDDIYGGHNVANGTDGDDYIDGAAGNDVILGDNGLIERTAAATDPRFTVLTGSLIYDSNGLALVVDGNQTGANPAGVEARRIALFDHDDSTTGNANNFGNDTIAGGADDDVIFGQLGDDSIHGDGLLDVSGTALATLSATIPGADVGGDDYIEGNGGGDTILGGLGQDDIVGGSSSLYNLTTSAMRPDGADTLFGGNGDMIARNDFGTAIVNAAGDLIITEGTRHARDSDAIVGDNGNIYRLVGTNGSDGGGLLGFNYDNYDPVKIVVRAIELLDYTPGGLDYSTNAANDIGAGDTIRGESGDDFIYGMVGNDVLFGDGQDDDLIGGYGHDWVSGGTGQDGILGDDGRIFTSRNSLTEPLNGLLTATVETTISTPGSIQQATINVTNTLKKAVDLTPFNPVAGGTELSDPDHADDILYGGLGSDFVHGGSGDDAISGAEALARYYDAPFNPGDVLRYSTTTGEFAEYDEFEPRLVILFGANAPSGYFEGAPFLLNFDHSEGTDQVNATYGTVQSDGDDVLFGDYGNDWIVGGSGQDNLYGGWGDDLLNADDDHSTNGGANDVPDTHPSYEDRAYGGAGRDRLIANTGGDRLIDWAGEFDSYIVPFAPFGLGTVSRALQPQIADFLYALSQSDGADFTRGSDGDARYGEPFGELGLVRQQDFAWKDQTGAPDDVQPGNIPGGARDVLRSAGFDDATTLAGTSFFTDSGAWQVQNSVLQVAADSLGGDAVAVYHVGEQLPSYFELQASVMMNKATGGWDANAYVIFDYQNKDDFKFVGIDDSINKLVMGHRDATGWHIDEQGVVKGGVKPGQYYNMLVAINGLNVTLVVDNKEVFQHTYAARIIDGYAYGLNWGLVGMGSNNARGNFDNIRVQILPPQVTFDNTEDFSDGSADLLTGANEGSWDVGGGTYNVDPGTELGLSLIDLGPDSLNFNAYLELNAIVNTQGRAGFIFDRYGDESFKYVAIDADSQRLIIGHYTQRGGWAEDAAVNTTIDAGTDYTLGLVLKGSTASATLNGSGNGGYQAIVGHVFNAATVDGNFGLMASGGQASFDDFRIKTDDPVFIVESGDSSMATSFDPDAVTDPDPVPEIDPVATYTSSQSAAIADRGVLISTIEVTDAFTLQDINVELNISHSRLSDLRVVLVSASGTRVELFNSIGGSGDNFTATLLDDEAADSILNGAAPYTGSFRPVGDLALLEGEQVNGTWTLEVYDQARKVTGTLDSWSLIVTRGEALLVSGTPELAADSNGLTDAQLAGIVEEAVRRWSDSGLLDADQLAVLHTLNFEIADLYGSSLGLATTDTIYIDSNAAGFGWFVDLTPADDSEFADPDGDGLYTAITDSAADGRMDLLTVVLHEIGHVLGLEHSDSGADALMSDTLADSTRIVHITATQEVATVGDSIDDAGQSLLWLQTVNELNYRDKRGKAGAD